MLDFILSLKIIDSLYLSKNNLNLFNSKLIFNKFYLYYSDGFDLDSNLIYNKMNFLIADLQITNWKYLNNLYQLNSKSEIEFLFNFLNKYSIDKIDEIKGFYSFIYFDSSCDNLFCFRDLIGVKSLSFYKNKAGKIVFLSFKKYNFFDNDLIELKPTFYLKIINYFNNYFLTKQDNYYLSNNGLIENKSLVKKNIISLFEKSILNFKSDLNMVGVMFSGGTDSTFIAMTLKNLNMDFICYTASIVGGNITEGEDIYYARKIANELNLKWELVEIDINQVEEITKNIIEIINDRKYTKVSVALAFYIALNGAFNDDIKTMLIGIGSEEIFADYKRDMDVEDINETCIEGLKSLWIRDLYRDTSLASHFNIDLNFPFLDNDFVRYSIGIDSKFKIDKPNKINKVILREILLDFGLSYDMAYRKKKAAQYGCKSDRVYEKLSKKKKMLKQEYLNQL